MLISAVNHSLLDMSSAASIVSGTTSINISTHSTQCHCFKNKRKINVLDAERQKGISLYRKARFKQSGKNHWASWKAEINQFIWILFFWEKCFLLLYIHQDNVNNILIKGSDRVYSVMNLDLWTCTACQTMRIQK